MRKAVDVETQVDLTPHYLREEDRLRKTATAFGFSRSTVSRIFRRVTYAKTARVGPNYVVLPTTEHEVPSLTKG